MSNLLIVTGCCLGLIVGWLLQCERVANLRDQRDRAEAERDEIAAAWVTERTGRKVIPIRTGLLR